jgi:hypothetical protein
MISSRKAIERVEITLVKLFEIIIQQLWLVSITRQSFPHELSASGSFGTHPVDGYQIFNRISNKRCLVSKSIFSTGTGLSVYGI